MPVCSPIEEVNVDILHYRHDETVDLNEYCQSGTGPLGCLLPENLVSQLRL